MLTLLAQTRADACSVIINSIDRTVIGNQEYLHAVALEIERVVPKGGVAFGSISEPLAALSANKKAPPRANFHQTKSSLDEAINVRAGMSTITGQRGLNPRWIENMPEILAYDRLLTKL